MRLFFLFVFIAIEFVAGATLLQGELIHDNCGVNSALVVLRRSGIEVDVKDFTDLLGVGNDMASPTNFYSLSGLFKRYNLKSYPFKGASIIDVLDHASASCYAIVQIKTPKEDHFLVVTKRDDGMVILDDYPSIGIIEGASSFESAFRKAFTGNVLFVSRFPIHDLEAMEAESKPTENALDATKATGAMPANSTLVTLQDKDIKQPKVVPMLRGAFITIPESIDLGTISPNSEEIDCNLTISNFSEDPIAIQKIQGTCSCFIGIDPYNTTVLPHSTESVVIHFNPSAMHHTGSNEISSAIAIQTNDPKLQVVKVFVHGIINSVFTWGVVPSKIDFGIVSLNKLKTWRSRLSLLALDATKESNVKIVGEPSSLESTVDILSKSESILKGSYIEYGSVSIKFQILPKQGQFDYLLNIQNKTSGEIQTIELCGIVNPN